MNALKSPAEPSNSEEEQDPLLKKRKLECEKEEPTALSPSKEGKDEAPHASSPSELTKKDETSGFAAYKKTNGFASFQNKASFSAYKTTDDTANAFTEQAKQINSDKDDRSIAVPTLTKVELANGEEDEQILQEQRGKLYKFVKSDYVEVGLGPVRILTKRNAVADRNNTRIVMRRESYPRGPGTKLILNARIKAFASVSVKTDRDFIFTILEPNEQKGELKEYSIHPVTYLLRFSAFENLEPFNQSLEQILNN